MYNEILQAVKTLAASYALPYTAIDHGAMPQENGLAMFPGPGYGAQAYMDKGATQVMYIALNGKHENLGILYPALSNIHHELSLLKTYPTGTEWEILNIETSTPPNYLDREASGTRQWLYGSLLRVKYYAKGI